MPCFRASFFLGFFPQQVMGCYRFSGNHQWFFTKVGFTEGSLGSFVLHQAWSMFWEISNLQWISEINAGSSDWSLIRLRGGISSELIGGYWWCKDFPFLFLQPKTRFVWKWDTPNPVVPKYCMASISSGMSHDIRLYHPFPFSHEKLWK